MEPQGHGPGHPLDEAGADRIGHSGRARPHCLYRGAGLRPWTLPQGHSRGAGGIHLS